jgi:hypothetical protein
VEHGKFLGEAALSAAVELREECRQKLGVLDPGGEVTGAAKQ